jgi:hypothetical protein
MTPNLKDKIILIAFYAFIIFLGTAFYISIFSINLMELNEVPLAKPLLLLMVTCLIFVFFLVHLKKYNKTPRILTSRDIVLIVMLLFFINYNFYGLIPFNCSRSNSILIMGYLNENTASAKTKDEIEKFVKEEYFNKRQAIQQRLNEQVKAGNIEEVKGKYKLTSRGVTVLKTLGFITDMYNMDTNLTKP